MFVAAQAGPLEAQQVVIALGASSDRVTTPMGYRPPTFGMRGYHMHYRPVEAAPLHRPPLDHDNGFMLVPMKAGIRLTTGVEFAKPGASSTPVQSS